MALDLPAMPAAILNMHSNTLDIILTFDTLIIVSLFPILFYIDFPFHLISAAGALLGEALQDADWNILCAKNKICEALSRAPQMFFRSRRQQPAIANAVIPASEVFYAA